MREEESRKATIMITQSWMHKTDTIFQLTWINATPRPWALLMFTNKRIAAGFGKCDWSFSLSAVFGCHQQLKLWLLWWESIQRTHACLFSCAYFLLLETADALYGSNYITRRWSFTFNFCVLIIIIITLRNKKTDKYNFLFSLYKEVFRQMKK